MARKVIQIARSEAMVNDDDGKPFSHSTTMVLCDDGSMWVWGKYEGAEEYRWARLADVPQND